jgi:2-C-methyl-D-erythritol 4-phosphate cytidylyltransferase
MFSNCIAVAQTHGNASTVVPANEVILVRNGDNGASDFLDRDRYALAQKPEAMRLGSLARLYEEADAQGITDSVCLATLAISLGVTMHFSTGSSTNLKITTAEDLDLFRSFLLARRMAR